MGYTGRIFSLIFTISFFIAAFIFMTQPVKALINEVGDFMTMNGVGTEYYAKVNPLLDGIDNANNMFKDVGNKYRVIGDGSQKILQIFDATTNTVINRDISHLDNVNITDIWHNNVLDFIVLDDSSESTSEALEILELVNNEQANGE